MTAEQVARLGPAFQAYLASFRSCFTRRESFAHLATYCRGLASDLPRKSVEPMALAAGTAVRTLQEFLTHHVWDHDAMLALTQRRIVEQHLPAPGQPASAPGQPASAPGTSSRDELGVIRDRLGVIGLIDETSVVKKGDKTPGVQRQYCGAAGKVENCIVSVHLAVRYGTFLAMLDSDLYLPDGSWDQDRDRCAAAHIPDSVAYRAKWLIALEQIGRATSHGVRFDWLTFDEGYGGKPEFLRQLDDRGMHYVCEVPRSFMCWPTRPKYHSLQAPFAAKRVDNAAMHGKPFVRQAWQSVRLARQTCEPQAWKVRAAQVHLQDENGRPTERTYWLIVAENLETGETKYFVSNAPAKTNLLVLLKVAFSRWSVEHAFRLVKGEIGFGHFEGRSWKGLLRHMILCGVVMLFVAEQTDQLRVEKPGVDAGADRAGVERRWSALAATPAERVGA